MSDMRLVNLIPLKEVDMNSKARMILSKSKYSEKDIYKLKDVSKDIISNLSSKENQFKSKLKGNPDGLYVQTDELAGTVLFSDGSEYELVSDQGGDITVTKK